MRRKNVLSSPHLSELRKEKKRIFWKKLSYISFAILATFIALGFLSRLDKINIQDVSVSGNISVDTDAIKKVVDEELSGHYIWLFPKTSFLLYPRGKVEEGLRENFKIFNDISINLGSANVLEISLSEREPAYTWCGQELLTREDLKDRQCYFSDKEGFIFAVAPYFSGDVYFRFFSSISNEEILGSNILPGNFEKVVALLDILKDMRIKPTSLLETTDDDDFEIYLSSSTLPPNSPKIVVSKDFDLEKTAENLQAALQTEPLQSDFKTKPSSLLYIDLSFGNRVYFKFK